MLPKTGGLELREVKYHIFDDDIHTWMIYAG